ncbi:male sterility protein-domain-containing protein [Fusarium tricinctum]|uniref:Fatty acyl-CoA reductase n=1 Tax=Fusarium tricinctum TaxID=61284 RepID=A0A8K0RJF7_9HYPO|nr:male sterility protein-domain-containing protein [Fusarium tricinctum]
MVSEIGNNILVTGATGFLGKVVIEELLRLREIYSISRIILLLRKKGPLDAMTRFEKYIVTSPCFASLPQGWKQFTQVVEGDLASPDCGLNARDYDQVRKTVTHIIHTAACIKFDSTVSEAISSNVDSSCNVLALAKDCHNLQQLVVTSTAYVSPPHQGPIYENLVELPCPASKLVSELKNGVLAKEEAIAATGHPNIYSLSKCLAEHMICETKGCLPVTLVRPSIICAAIHFPEPGWIDSRAAFGGLVLGFSTGALLVLDGRPETKLDIVPVDVVAESLIYETFRKGAKIHKQTDLRIVFSVATVERSLTLADACKMLEIFFQRRLQYIGPQGHMLDLYKLVYQDLPFHLDATVNGIKGTKSREAQSKKIWKVVNGMSAVFRSYTNSTHDFRPKHAKVHFDPVEYMHIICQGVQKNLRDSKL